MAGMDMLAVRATGVLAAVAPPVAVAGVQAGRDAVMDRPVLAMVLLLGYETLIAVLLFTGKIAAKLQERWQDRIVNPLDRTLQQRLSRFDQRYREFMLGSLRFIDLKGLATVGFYTPELDEVFIDVSLAFREASKVSGGLLATLPAEVTDRHSLGDFLDRPKPAVLVVIGAPGSGKTTLLRYTARQLCRAHRGRQRTIPILLYLRDQVTTIASNPHVPLAELVRGTLGRYGVDEPGGWFEQRLHDGDCLVLLDGLDEVARPTDRRVVASWVERQIRQYPKNDYVITSRPQGYLTARIDGAAVLQVRSFTDEQVRCFVQSWYLAIEQGSTGVTGKGVRLRAESAANDLLQRLDGAPELYELTVNPLLLTMIANIHRYLGKLPDSRVDLYGEICDAMLGRRQEAKNLPNALDGHQKETLLGGLAFTMMRRQVRSLPRVDVLAKIGAELHRMSGTLTAEGFLADIGSNGMLIEYESGLYSFAHRTFQEYLAATHISATGLSNVLVDAVDDDWWRETTLLYTARSDADPIVRACLASSSVAALSLAFDCADQDGERARLAPELHDRLDALLASAFAADTDPERRRLMTGVLLTRHLRHLIRTDSGGRVCARPITAALYHLYQQDTQGHAPERPIHFESGPERPIMGVRGSDAVAFVHWVNAITGGDTVYRLPIFAEIDDPALRRVFATPAPGSPAHSVWLKPDSEHTLPELWASADTDHPHLIDSATLAGHVKADIERSTHTLIRLLLLRSIITIRVFASALDRALALNLARSRDLYGALDRALARVLALSRVSALTLDFDLDFDLDRALDRADEFDLTLDRALTRVRDFDFALALDRALVIDLDRALALDRPLDLARAGGLNRTLAFALSLARTLDLALARALDRALKHARPRALALAGALDDYRAHVMGNALARALTHALRRDVSATTWPTEFVKEFIAATDIAKSTYVISPEILVDKLGRGHETLINLLGAPDGLTSPSWAHQIARNLQKISLPIFNGQQRLTMDTATAIRLAALCLAAEADVRHTNQLGDLFREIAAGVTLLERRATGQAALTETIMLAIA